MGPFPWFRISTLLIIVQFTFSADHSHLSRDYLEGIINHVNSAGAHWEAGHNFEEIDSEMVQQLLGTEHSNSHPQDLPSIDHIYAHASNEKPIIPGLPHGREDFDGLKEWNHCPSVKKIQNQGKCAGDWASTTVAAISDRICLNSNGTNKVQLSSHELLSCCKSCGWGCRKGFPQMVYKKFVTKGLVTGGDYNSKQGCQPYEIKPCKGNFKKCFLQNNYATPKCKPYCYNSHYKKKYSQDIYKGAEAFQIFCPGCAAGELVRHGPLTATMKVYEDFLTYKKGIYHHVTGKPLGFLTVKLVGFNDTAKPYYWIATNSWGKKWGDNGVFRIQRYNMECMIEGSMRGVFIKKDNPASDEAQDN